MDSNDSSANTTITFGDNAAPAHTTSEDEHVTASSSSDGKGKKSAEKRRQDIYSEGKKCAKNLDRVQVHREVHNAIQVQDHQVLRVPHGG